MIQSSRKHSDLFLTTLHDLHSEAAKEMLDNRREHLQRVKQSSPNSASTAEACLSFPSLNAVHHARSSSIVTLLVLRSFICIWARFRLAAGRAEAFEVEHVRAR